MSIKLSLYLYMFLTLSRIKLEVCSGTDIDLSAAEFFPDRSEVQCLHRWQKVLNPELVKGPWTQEVGSCISSY